MSTTKNNNSCACGCGTPCKKDFAPGHDNRFYGQVIRNERDPYELEAFPGLLRKWQAKSVRKVDGSLVVTRTVEPVQEYDRDPEPGFVGPAAETGFNQVKVGRWWYDIKGIKALDGGLFDVDWVAKNGNVRTSRVDAQQLRYVRL